MWQHIRGSSSVSEEEVKKRVRKTQFYAEKKETYDSNEGI